jgi:hypothetical protein
MKTHSINPSFNKYLKTELLPHGKLSVFIIKTKGFMVLGDIITAASENQDTNTVRE